ncbi:protein kinase domain-containing protein [Persicirhabdus sediminis]|uniref:Protein kinase n=1 Tax=Persicirhabdus sediminis TaxID=454144 RepID=A0A8J7MCQ5_9BACT|nr:protein kinase [Persicirhabdus sediminis]MBK1790087.1 protein kinase [Persicirhabdus sediminis]
MKEAEQISERYRTTRQIGAGGFGVVYQGVDERLKREVAIKRMLPQREGKRALPTQMLYEEAAVLASLQHPNIVTIHDICNDDHGVLVVMELLKGKTLNEAVERQECDLIELRDLVVQTQDALSAAREANIVHCDLKPQNIMCSPLPSGSVQYKLLDFDQARLTRNKDVETSSSKQAMRGSIYFMAPEQFEGKPGTFESDQYAMGCIYYYCLTGVHPFDGDSAVQVMASHIQGRMTPLLELRPDLPVWLDTWLMRLLAHDPAKRPGSPQEVMTEFLDHYNCEGKSSLDRQKEYAARLRRKKELEASQSHEPSGASEVNTTDPYNTWYYAQGSRVSGPHNRTTIKEFVAQAVLSAEDLIWSPTLDSWLEVKDVDFASTKLPDREPVEESKEFGMRLPKWLRNAVECLSLELSVALVFLVDLLLLGFVYQMGSLLIYFIGGMGLLFIAWLGLKFREFKVSKKWFLWGMILQTFVDVIFCATYPKKVWRSLVLVVLSGILLSLAISSRDGQLMMNKVGVKARWGALLNPGKLMPGDDSSNKSESKEDQGVNLEDSPFFKTDR